MPKIKSHSGAKKRFKRTARGKWLAKKPGLRHLMAGRMTAAVGRQKRRKAVVSKMESKVLNAFLPY